MSVVTSVHVFMLGCGGVLTETSGTFGSTGSEAYNSEDYKCQWTIQVAQRIKIALIFDSLSLTDESTCTNEYIKVISLEAPSIDTFFGHIGFGTNVK